MYPLYIKDLKRTLILKKERLTLITLQLSNEIIDPSNAYLGPESQERGPTYMSLDGRTHSTTYDGFFPKD